MSERPLVGPPPNLLGFKIRRVHNLLTQLWAGMARQHGVEQTPVETGILMVVRDNPGVSHGDLARVLGVDTSTLSQAVTPLITRGLIRREQAPQDRRARHLSLTAEGAEAMERIDALVAERQKLTPGSLTADEAEHLNLLLDKALEVVPANGAGPA